MKIDVVVPRGNEDVLLEMAVRLGFKEIILLYTKGQDIKPELKKPSSVKIIRAIFVSDINLLSGAKRYFDLVFAPSQREFVENPNVDYVILDSTQDGKDFFYQKRAALDDAVCAIAKAKEKMMVFNVGSCDGKTVFGRMAQDAMLCRKYELKALVCSFADTPLAMRAPNDLDGFARSLRLS
jgi:RNase P/RNase MRP subunit p30